MDEDTDGKVSIARVIFPEAPAPSTAPSSDDAADDADASEATIAEAGAMASPLSGLRFDGKVAVVTGAGNGLGKEFAKLFAARGAKVLVNDLGGNATGSGSSKAPADQTVAEIKEAGGEATANYDSVVEGEKVIAAAISAYGRVDILVNNAGIARDVSLRKMTDKDWELLYKVNLLGVYKCTRAAWPHMESQKHGRILNISASTALVGYFGTSNFTAMKGGVLGFSFSLAQEGEKRGINVNVIAPHAATRFSEPVMSKDLLQLLKPSTIAKLAVFLCHETCGLSAQLFEAAGHTITQVRWQRSRGVRFSEDSSIEDLAKEISAVGDFTEGADTPTLADDLIRREMESHRSKI